jgi:hypothetical protein
MIEPVLGAVFEYVREAPLDDPSSARRLSTARSVDGAVAIQRSGRDFETGTMRFDYSDRRLQGLIFVSEALKAEGTSSVWQVSITHVHRTAEVLSRPTAEELSGCARHIVRALETWPDGDFERFRHNMEKLREVEII